MADDDFRLDYSQELADADARDWDSPIGKITAAATERVADYAELTAPVSATGSKYAPPGFLKSHLRADTSQHDDDGTVLGLAGTSTNRHGGAYPYPQAFVAGPTRNRGGKSTRRENRYLQDSLASLDEFVYLDESS